jgi:hypothetical protein
MPDQPNFETARVDRSKIVDYLLGSSSFAAVAKARFFQSLGFSAEGWEEMANALRAQAKRATIAVTVTRWGIKYVATGEIDAPNGRQYKIVSVWISDSAEARLITAYPAKE